MHESILVSVSVQPGEILFWLSPFRRGVRVYCRTGLPLSRVLVEQFGLEPDYIEKRVRTVFINGCPVDNLESAILSDGDELALAGAMPGLVGICMGRNSPVAGFRRDITFKGGESEQRDGRILLKLFNNVGEEAGPLLLARGVLLSGAELRTLVGRVRADGHCPLAVTLAGQASRLSDLEGLREDLEWELRVAEI
ncbi:MAG: hypothetical protein AB7E32_09490 [Desulfovibrio sp.]